MNNNLDKEKALEVYYASIRKISLPDGSCYGLAKYTADILEVIETLYEHGYLNGYKDALNTDFEFKK